VFYAPDRAFSLDSYPIVLFSLTADPVTPLAAAQKMQAGFGNESSTLVVQSGCVLPFASPAPGRSLRMPIVRA